MTVPPQAPARPPLTKLRTYAYVDGFNLYYRALRKTSFKWLNIRALLETVLDPENDLQAIRYYTANVSGKLDPDCPKRQQVYLRALETIPGLTITKGKFLVSLKWAPMEDPPSHLFRPSPEMVQIIRTDEKGSDVNLASHLLRDGFQDLYDVAVVVTNDTDLVEPVRIVVQDLKKPVGLVCPSPQAAKSLKKVASFVKHLNPGRLSAAQFDPVIPGTTIMRPPSWK